MHASMQGTSDTPWMTDPDSDQATHRLYHTHWKLQLCSFLSALYHANVCLPVWTTASKPSAISNLNRPSAMSMTGHLKRPCKCWLVRKALCTLEDVAYYLASGFCLCIERQGVLQLRMPSHSAPKISYCVSALVLRAGLWLDESKAWLAPCCIAFLYTTWWMIW